MRDSTRLRPLGLLVMLAGCQPGGDAVAQPTSKGGPNEPDYPAVPQPSPMTSLPTTTAGSSIGEASTSTSTSTTTTTAEPGSTSDATATSAPVPAGCGDGVVDAESEQCDDGYQGNSDNAACSSTCKAAFCGDGLLWVGEEACDHGPNNNDTSYGGCTESCALGPRCGDGVLQAEAEECDASAPPVEGGAPCDPLACRFEARVAFVTDTKFSGALGGLAFADATCAAAAAAQGLDNASSFTAWLSDGVATPVKRLKNAAAASGYPYVRLDGQLLADDLADLIAHGPKVPLDVTETGVKLAAQELAWTNIGLDGQFFSAVNHCKEWTSQALLSTARVGKVSPSAADLPAWKAAHAWTSDAVATCAFTLHLYCFED